MHKNAKMVGLDCAASVLGKVGHGVVVSLLLSSEVVVDVIVLYGSGKGSRDQTKKASVESMTCYNDAQWFRFQAGPWIANLRVSPNTAKAACLLH